MAEDLEIKAQLENFENMLMLRNYINRMLKYDLSGTHLSLRECQLLMYIYQHGQTGTSELAQVFKVTRTLISKTLGQLMQANLIREQAHRNDRRRVDISLTDNGIKQVVAVKKQISNNLQSMDATKELLRLTEQIASLSQ
ncbi:MarR family transcriptional regulator [Lactiplantibacillus plantarum]|uniref:Transcription regulator n=2 Tax=Lactiplantibacillus plantarum TaxID=1590 RepID=A0AAW3RPA7_LACPN|nr:MarR family transcriptional regulator [Lactiplantibacillus plantarum]ASZ34955.1 MarR family transcriptional regulator [Lactiplantibacillus plantarum]KPN44565.1 putative transcriptional regulator [Lactiplantibacillus plantarum WJL]KZV01273.1 transcription regulator [Lactiplantibacillus plantarum]KZV06403.1 transcription regulator [Lactiplantibacillus plantarum]MBF9193540.1 MarR family transcriptional regulator [Lactiplantibacillus plantarum]